MVLLTKFFLLHPVTNYHTKILSLLAYLIDIDFFTNDGPVLHTTKSLPDKGSVNSLLGAVF